MIESQQLLFIIGMSILVAGVFWALHQTRQKLEQTELQLEQIKNSLIALKSTGIGQGKRIIDVNSQLKKLESKQHTILPGEVSDKSYKQAAKMLSMGVEAEEIMECCGLNRGEIQLLIQLNSSANNGKSFH